KCQQGILCRARSMPAHAAPYPSGRSTMSSPNKLRVIQWATGGVGKAAIECVVNHPQLELVGCWVHSADKNGRDVGEILGTAALAVTASSSNEEVLALDADCVV